MVIKGNGAVNTMEAVKINLFISTLCTLKYLFKYIFL